MAYTINDIESLSFKDGVRQRIAMYLGSADMQGVYNAIQEIISNSIDEFYMGFGSKIEIGLSGDEKGPIVTITDHGRGVPFGTKEDGSNVLVDIFSRPHTGGKFNDKVYNSVAGLNGIGAKATCLSSLRFNVSVVRDGRWATAKWEKGVLIDYQEKDYHDKKATGTSIQFTPDPEVYNLEPINIDFDVLCQRCKNLSYLTRGFTFDLIGPNNKHVIYCAKNGLLDLIKDNAEGALHSTPVYHTIKEGPIEAEVAMMWTKGKEKCFTFTNGLQQSEGGTSLTGVKTAITNFIKKQFKGEFDGEMARTGLVYAVSCKIPNPSFANQTKTKINNPELRGIAQRAAGTALETFATRKANEFQAITDFLAKERKAEAAAERARRQVLDNVKEVNNAAKKGVFDVDKLADAENIGENAVLLLVEGKSAGGAMQRVRDPKKYGILKLRGKIINALSNDFEDVMRNEEVKLFLKATGINISNYRESKLRYGKVAICVDADDDGMHIACLIISLLYKLAPDFLKEGRLCWLHAPLFKVKKGKETKFYYTEDQLRSGIKGEQTRFKGLGEMKDEDARCMFDTNQWLEVLEWDPSVAAQVEALMGKDSQPKKDFVFSRINFEELE
jgi:DNA gyrase/topoisomerase IV subunit B